MYSSAWKGPGHCAGDVAFRGMCSLQNQGEKRRPESGWSQGEMGAQALPPSELGCKHLFLGGCDSGYRDLRGAINRTEVVGGNMTVIETDIPQIM